MFVRIEFLMGTGWNIAHRHQNAAFNASSIEFPRLTNIDQAGSVFAEQAGCFGGRDFVIEHTFSVERRCATEDKLACNRGARSAGAR